MAEVRISPLKEWWNHTFGSWLNLAVYWRERRAILDQPKITVMPGSRTLASGSFKFALQSVVLVPLLTSVLSATLSYVSEIPPEFLEGMLEEFERMERSGLPLPPSQRRAAPIFGVETEATRYEALKVFIRAREQSQRLLPFLLSISIVLSASLFRMSFRRWRSDFPLVSQADRAYLYYVGARLFLPITIFGLSSYLVDMSARYAIVPFGPAFEESFSFQFPYAGIVWLLVRLALVIWVVTALWSSTSVLSDVLNLHGKRKGRPVKGRRAVATRLFAAQVTALLFVRLVEFTVLAMYYSIHI